MRKYILTLSVISLFNLPFNSATAGPSYSMEDLSSLQTEYQGQLVLHPQKRHKAPPRKKIAVKRPKPVTRHLPKVQRRVAPQPRYVAPTRQPTSRLNPKSLFNAAVNGNNALIGKLLQQGININMANAERETALHMAAARGRYSTVIYLVNHGANIHARTVKNWLPIHHATRFRHANIANYLIQRGSSPHARTSDGLSAIDIARSTHDQRLLGLFGAR
jgi:ankyrin repeat protein